MSALIHLKSPRDLEILRYANRIVAEILTELRTQITPGVSTLELSPYDLTRGQITYRVT